MAMWCRCTPYFSNWYENWGYGLGLRWCLVCMECDDKTHVEFWRQETREVQ